MVTYHWQKDLLWQTWDLFFLTLALTIFFIPYCSGFYIYTLTASIFREELKRIVIQCFRRRQTQVNIITLRATRT